MPEVRLIDRQAAIQSIKNDYCSECVCDLCSACEYRFCIDILENAPTIEAGPVRHGRWVMNNPYGIKCCSECGYAQTIGAENYCSNCGARMDVEGRF